VTPPFADGSRTRQFTRVSSPAPARVPAPAARPEDPIGPADERFVYHLTAEGRRALEGWERAHGRAAHRPAAAKAAVAEPCADHDRRARRKARAAEAAAAGNGDGGVRFGTVGCRWRGDGRVPEVRLAGKWLGEAVFDFGREFEITVEPGRLTLQAV
jgi:hypothetical protein